jgi:hypothetical protein
MKSVKHGGVILLCAAALFLFSGAEAPGRIGTPYRTWYISSGGNDRALGTVEAPLATVREGLARIAAAYAEDWPGKGTAGESRGALRILDRVEVREPIEINGNTGYPPIILGGSGGTLLAGSGLTGASLLHITRQAEVTLEEGLNLEGNGNGLVRGVTISGSVFTMDGGRITGFSLAKDSRAVYGGGVAVVQSGRFTMNGGEISNNRVGNRGERGSSIAYGGGVAVNSGIFVMNRGKIAGNSVAAPGGVSSTSYGGGVYVGSSGRFTMKDGEITGNRVLGTGPNSVAGGGGVSVSYFGRFTLEKGKISGNQALTTDNRGASQENQGNNSPGNSQGYSHASGGGVNISSGSFTMTGGEISGNLVATAGGYEHEGGGGVYFDGKESVFIKTGGSIYGYSLGESRSNVVTGWDGTVLTGKSHAVCMADSFCSDETVGTLEKLSYGNRLSLSGER